MRRFENIRLNINNIFRLFSGFNTVVISKSEPDNYGKILKSRSTRVDMQMPVNPGNALYALLVAIGYTASLASKPIIYALSVSKALLVAGATTAIIRPGIPFRAIREFEKTLAQIVGYRELTVIADEKVAQAMSAFLLKQLLNLLNNPIAMSLFFVVCGAIGLSGLKRWVEYLVSSLKGSGKGLDSYDSRPTTQSQLFLPGVSQLEEENRRLRVKVKQLERMKRFRGGINAPNFDYYEID